MAKVLDSVREKAAFAQPQGNSGPTEGFQDLVNVRKMRFHIFSEDDDAVQIDETALPFEGAPDNTQSSLKRHRCVGKPERHMPVAVCPRMAGVGRLVAILRRYWYFPIARVTI